MSSNLLVKAVLVASLMFSWWGLCRGDDPVNPDGPPLPRCGRDIQQAEYSGWPMKNPIRQIFCANETYMWSREQLLRRLPDGSLFCAFYTGGPYEYYLENMVAAIRSDDDGKTWSDVEVICSRPDRVCWAPSMYVHKNRAHIFWFTKDVHGFCWRNMVNHVLSTGPDGRAFTNDRVILRDSKGRKPEFAVDVRHGTQLRDGRVLLPIAWQDSDNIRYVGVMEPNDDFTSFTRYGRICKKTPNGPTPSVLLFENAIAELPDEKLAMLIRGEPDGTAERPYRLWRSDSDDSGRTWSEPYVTDIPNPGTKPRIINLPDGRIVLFHNPRERDSSDPKFKHPHRHRTQLEMWVSSDGMKSWYLKRTLVSAPKVAQYPDGFYDAKAKAIYLAWEDEKTLYFLKIDLDELS